MIIRVVLIAVHLGAVLGPALIITAFTPTGTGLLAFPRLIAGGGPFVIAILALSVAQAVTGSVLALRNLRTVTPVGVHVIGPTFIAWVGLAGSTLGVAWAGDATDLAGGSEAVQSWALSLATADLPRQYGFLVTGWGWLAALATVALGAFSRRGGAPLKPGYRLAIIAAACTLPTVVILIGGDLVAVHSGLYLIGIALGVGVLMAHAAPTVSIWSVSDDPASRSLAFSTIWLCGCAAVVAVATQGLGMAWHAQSAALAAIVSTDRTAIANPARAQAELSTELTYLAAGLALAWLTLAMRGRRVVLSAPSQNIGSVLVTLVLATSIGVANNLYEHGASRRHNAVLTANEPIVPADFELATAALPDQLRSTTVVRIDATGMSTSATGLATRENGTWVMRDDAALDTAPAPAGPAWQRTLCGETGKELAVAAAGGIAGSDLLGALNLLRNHGVCRIEMVGRQSSIPFGDGVLSPWVSGVIEYERQEPHGVTWFLATDPPEGAAVITVARDHLIPADPPADRAIALRWDADVTVAEALALAPAPYAILLLPTAP